MNMSRLLTVMTLLFLFLPGKLMKRVFIPVLTLMVAALVLSVPAARAAVGLELQGARMKFDDLAPAYTRNGFAEPSRGLGGLSVFVFGQRESGFRLGITLSGLMAKEEENGDFRARYGVGFAGLYLGQQWGEGSSVRWVADGTVGLGGATLTVFSPNQDGEISRPLLVLQPRFGAEFLVSETFRIGLRAGWIFYGGGRAQKVGDDLDVDITPRSSFNVALQFLWGLF